MKRQKPKYTLEEHSAAYDYCRDQRPPRWPMRLAYAALDAFYRTNIEFAERAQNDLEQVNRDGLPHVYVFNHLTTDHFIVGSIMHQIAPQDVGNIRVLGNNVTLQNVRPIADMAGAVPVYRQKDFPDNLQAAGQTYPELYDCCYDLQRQGYKISLHPEGDTNKKNPLEMTEVKKGAAVIALRSAPSAITPIGYSYGPTNLDDPKRGRVFARVERTIFVTSDQTVEQITRRVRTALQSAVVAASAFN